MMRYRIIITALLFIFKIVGLSGQIVTSGKSSVYINNMPKVSPVNNNTRENLQPGALVAPEFKGKY